MWDGLPAVKSKTICFKEVNIMYVVTINQDICEGCGECADNCPASILEMVDGKAQVTGELDDCLGCETCMSVCPSGAVKVEES